MNARERRMVLVLGVCLLFGVAFAGYSLIYTPIQDLKAEAEQVEYDKSIKEAILEKLQKDQKRAEAAKLRSLPADADLARVEYVLMMRKLLDAAGVPAGYTIVSRDNLDTKGIPVFDQKSKKPVYSKIGYVVHMKRVDLPTVAKFLYSYYRLNLLQQITFLNIRRDQEGAAASTRTSSSRTDLDVTIHTEAVLLDGAENRRTLLPMPLSAAAVGGGAGFQALLHTREVGRGISPLQLADVLASSKTARDYTHIAARDFIHGPLPEPPDPGIVKGPPEPPPLPPKPKEDISPYIKLTGTYVASDGVGEATIWDQANNRLYVITLKPKGERYDVKVEKLYPLNEKKWKQVPDGLWTDLVIHEDETATSRKFKVVGLDGLDLVLTEMATLSARPTKSESGKSPRPGMKATVKLPPPPPAAAVVGGSGAALAAPPGESVFVWRIGQTLQSITALSGEDADAALRRAAPSIPTAATEAASPTSAPLSKAD